MMCASEWAWVTKSLATLSTETCPNAPRKSRIEVAICFLPGFPYLVLFVAPLLKILMLGDRLVNTTMLAFARATIVQRNTFSHLRV
jgi:hypothetical protein